MMNEFRKQDLRKVISKILDGERGTTHEVKLDNIMLEVLREFER